MLRMALNFHLNKEQMNQLNSYLSSCMPCSWSNSFLR